jgi:hypothetical protein
MQYNRISFIDGSSEPTLNVTASVGLNGKNLSDDVMLIQAMIGMIAKGDQLSLGLNRPGFRIPTVTGIMDADTQDAITQFQITNRLFLLKVDHRIDTAHYRGRRLHRGVMPNGSMSITMLHLLANDVNRLLKIPTDDPSDALPYRGALVRMHPGLKGKIDAARHRHVAALTD